MAGADNPLEAVYRRPIVVGMGVCVTDVEALERFFGGVPQRSGLAFVVVQASDSRQSLTSEQLARCTSLPVVAVDGNAGVAVKGDHVYLAPEGKLLSFADGRLRLSEPRAQSLGDSPIDFFFRSLAEELQERAICALVTPVERDGRLGLSLVQGHGGLAMVQAEGIGEEEWGAANGFLSCRSADCVLPVEQMGEKLLQSVKSVDLEQCETQVRVDEQLEQVLGLLRVREEQLRFILEAARIGTWNWDLRTDEFQWSENLERMHGLQEGEFDGTFAGFLRGVHPHDRDGVQQAIDRALETSDEYRCEYRLWRNEETTGWVEGKGRVVYGADGTAVRVSGICLDITEWKQAEEAVRESEEKYRLLVDGARNYALFMLSPQGQVTSWNAGAERLIGYRADEILGQDFGCLYRVEDVESGSPESHLRVARESGHSTEEGLRLRRDGTLFWAQVTVTAFHDSSGKLSGFGILVRDISERKKIEKQIENLVVQEHQRLGHEVHEGLGQELTGLSFLAQSLYQKLRDGGSPEVHVAEDLSKGIQHALSHIRMIVKGLVPVEIDAEGLMSALQELAASTEQGHGLTCRFECNRRVRVDDSKVATQLFRIAQEAVNHAVKHADAETIVIRLELTGDQLSMIIEDDGDGGIVARHGGEGKGLQIMRYRASLISAQLIITSSPETGTRVECHIPSDQTSGSL